MVGIGNEYRITVVLSSDKWVQYLDIVIHHLNKYNK